MSVLPNNALSDNSANEQQITLSVEGSIGSGKSTLLKLMSQHLGDSIEVIEEPVEMWKNCRGSNLLQLFYSNPQRWAYTFQSYAFMSRLMCQAKLPKEKGVRIIERCAASDKHIFAENAYTSGLLTQEEWNVYEDLWDFYTARTDGAPDMIVYLATSPDICLQRMKKRGRPEEETVSLGYLESIHKQHEKWLPHESGVTVDGTPYIRLDGNSEFASDRLIQETMIATIQKAVADFGGKGATTTQAPEGGGGARAVV